MEKYSEYVAHIHLRGHLVIQLGPELHWISWFYLLVKFIQLINYIYSETTVCFPSLHCEKLAGVPKVTHRSGLDCKCVAI